MGGLNLREFVLWTGKKFNCMNVFLEFYGFMVSGS
jgi:hypothetical protein